MRLPFELDPQIIHHIIHSAEKCRDAVAQRMAQLSELDDEEEA